MDFYSKNLDQKINGRTTLNLIDKLSEISDKVNLVNYYLSWLHTAKFDPNRSSGASLIDKTFSPKLVGTNKELRKLLYQANKMLETWVDFDGYT